MALFRVPELKEEELQVIAKIDELRNTLRYATSAPKRWTGLLRRATFARAIRGSNSIEGIVVTVDDAVAAVDGDEPLDATAETWAAITGYRIALSYILQLCDDPHFSYSAGFIRSIHYMMLQYDLSKHPGKWRLGPIYVRDEQTGQRVYEGPDVVHVPALVEALVDDLNDADRNVPPKVRAALAHLNLVMIHPFADGNGRMARALQTLVLAREGFLQPQFCSIEEYLGRNTQEYYAVLKKVGASSWHPEGDTRPWVRFCLVAHYRQATTLLRRTREIQRLWDELEIEVKRRGLPERSLMALADAAMGYKVRNSTYRSANPELSETLASRDLKMLVDAGFLIAVGDGRGRYYVASDRVKALRQEMREPKIADDPFDVDSGSRNPYLPGFAPEKSEVPR